MYIVLTFPKPHVDNALPFIPQSWADQQIVGHIAPVGLRIAVACHQLTFLHISAETTKYQQKTMCYEVLRR